MPNNRTEYLPYIHTFRGIAMLFIVAVHLYWNLKSSEPQVFKFLHLLFGNGTVLFVFISGFLFQHLLPKYDLKVYLSKKLRYVLLPYIFVSVPALVLYFFDLPYAQNHSSIDSVEKLPFLRQLLLLLVNGSHLAQFWFIPMIAIIYLISPVLQAVDETPKLYFLLPILLMVAFFIGRFHYRPFLSLFYFLPVYLLGMFISHYKERLFQRSRIFLLFTFLTFLLASYLRYKFDNYNLLYFQKIALAIFLILTLRKIKSGSPLVKLFTWIADYSFSIYFLHIYINMAITHFALEMHINSFFKSTAGFVLKVAMVIVLSVLLTRLVKAIVGTKSRFLVGS